MPNGRQYQFLYSKVPMLSMLDVQVSIGAAGAVSSSAGNGLASVTLLATGIYQIQSKGNYNAFVGSDVTVESPVTGANVADGAFVIGTMYQITAVGTTNWQTAGLNAGLTAAIGQSFVATSIGGAGTGTAKVVGSSNLSQVEVVPPDQMLTSSQVSLGRGALILVRTLDTALALVAPTSGTQLRFNLYFRDSSSTY